MTEIALDAELQRATLPSTRRPSRAPRRSVSFRGELNDQLHGFYRSTYTDDEGTHTIATTQFEAADARRAFPCWDEPDLKAVFGVTLVVPEGIVALSNGPEVEREPTGDGRVRVRFADTMSMSTYLVAFVVGPARADRAGRRRRRAAARRAPARQGPPGAVRPRGRRVLAAVLHRLLRHPLPRPEGRLRGPARLRARGDGEHGPHHLPRVAAARRSRARDPARAREHRRRRRARARPPVVRQPRHDAVVERHLAERGLRHVHGAAHGRRAGAPTGSAGPRSAATPPSRRRSTRCARPARSSTRCTRPTTPRACSTC